MNSGDVSQLSGESLATGGNSHSPLKAFRISAFHSNLEPNLEKAREELRDTMRGKSASLDHDSFMDNFFPTQDSNTPPMDVPNIFKDAPKFSSEKQMYNWLVSAT